MPTQCLLPVLDSWSTFGLSLSRAPSATFRNLHTRLRAKCNFANELRFPVFRLRLAYPPLRAFVGIPYRCQVAAMGRPYRIDKVDTQRVLAETMEFSCHHSIQVDHYKYGGLPD